MNKAFTDFVRYRPSSEEVLVAFSLWPVSAETHVKTLSVLKLLHLMELQRRYITNFVIISQGGSWVT
jgi:hypothetical protein